MRSGSTRLSLFLPKKIGTERVPYKKSLLIISFHVVSSWGGSLCDVVDAELELLCMGRG